MEPRSAHFISQECAGTCMRGRCRTCRQPIEIIESCIDTLDIHYMVNAEKEELCPGSGSQFDEYLEPPGETASVWVGDTGNRGVLDLRSKSVNSSGRGKRTGSQRKIS